ncbi:putative efflux system component YknX [Phycisphaerae bacterium RAS1]|nr:putative efflux system component YknX [Phycisphaerae bacterium RAS1]
MKLTVIIGAVVLLGGLGVLQLGGYFRPSRAEGDEMLFSVRRGRLTVTITENGSLMAKNSEKIVFRGRRGGKITMLIEEGKTVAAEEVLCKLDTMDLENQKQQLELDIVKSDADLVSARTELDIQKTDNVANIEKAQIALNKARNELERYRDGEAPKERRNLEVLIKQAETDHSRAKKKYEDSIKLLEKNYINKSQATQDEIEFERAEIKLVGARRDLELFDKYTLPMTLVDKEAAVADAQRGLNSAEKRAASTLGQKQAAVAGAEQRLSSQKKNLKEVSDEIERFTIKCPSPGIVIYGEPNQPWQREDIKLGGQIWGGFTLFTIPDLRVMQVQVQVHEADINKIKDGQKTTVTMDTYPGLVLKGEVTKIATIAGEGGGGWRGGGNEEVKKFTVDIVLDSTEGLTLKPGISAKAEIFVDERDDVLYVPRQCVFIEEGTHYSYVMRGRQPQRVAVKPELSNDTYIQIAEGVAEGDRVLLYNPTIQTGAASGASESSSAAVPAATQATGGAP